MPKLARSPHRQLERVTLDRDPLFRLAQFVFLLKLSLVVLVFDPGSFDPTALPKSTVSHAVSYVLAGLLAVLLFRFGKAFVSWNALHWAAVALVGSFALAAPFAVDRTVALFGTTGRYLGLTYMLDCALLYLGAVTLVRSTRDLWRLAAATAGTAALVILYGSIQRLGLDPIFPAAVAVTPLATLGQPDLLSGYLGIVAASSIALAITPWSRAGLIGRVALGTVAAGACVLLISGLARNGLLALGGGIAAALVILFISGVAKRRSLLAFGAISLALVAALVLLSPMRARLTPAALGSETAAQRLDLYESTLKGLASRPLLGFGPDNFAAAYSSIRSADSVLLNSPEAFYDSTHSWLLYIGTSAGVIGLASAFALIALAAAKAFALAARRDPRALAAIPLAAYFGQGMVNITDQSVDWIWWVGLGVLGGSGAVSAIDVPKLRLDRSRFLAAPALALAVAAVWTSVPRLESGVVAGEARRLNDSGRSLEAVPLAIRATILDDRRAAYWELFASALSNAGNASAAANAYRETLKRAPWQPAYWRALAIVQVNEGDVEGAIASLERNVQVDPYDAHSLDLLARLLLGTGRLPEAAARGELAARLLPTEPSVNDAPVLAKIHLGRWRDAVAQVEAAISAAPTPHLYVLLAEAYDAGHDSSGAMTAVAHALSLDPSDVEALALKQRLASP